MKKFKRTLRLIGMVLFIILALFGVMGIAPPRRNTERKADTIEIVIERRENEEKETDVVLFEVKE